MPALKHAVVGCALVLFTGSCTADKDCGCGDFAPSLLDYAAYSPAPDGANLIVLDDGEYVLHIYRGSESLCTKGTITSAQREELEGFLEPDLLALYDDQNTWDLAGDALMISSDLYALHVQVPYSTPKGTELVAFIAYLDALRAELFATASFCSPDDERKSAEGTWQLPA